MRAGLGHHPGLRRRSPGRHRVLPTGGRLTAPATMQSEAMRRSGALTMRRLALAGTVLVTLLASCALLLAGCSGRDAVAQGGTFEFVSPGGKTDIYYDPPAIRGRAGTLPGPDR